LHLHVEDPIHSPYSNMESIYLFFLFLPDVSSIPLSTLPSITFPFFSFDIGCAFFPFRGYVYVCMDDYIHISTYILLLPFHFLLPSSLFFFRRAQIRDGSTNSPRKTTQKIQTFLFFIFLSHRDSSQSR
jgi:hypothetical protein